MERGPFCAMGSCYGTCTTYCKLETVLRSVCPSAILERFWVTERQRKGLSGELVVQLELQRLESRSMVKVEQRMSVRS